MRDERAESTRFAIRERSVLQKWNPGSDTNGPPDEVVEETLWSYVANVDGVERSIPITDPAEIARLEAEIQEEK